MTGSTVWEEKAKQILDAFSSRINTSPSVFTQSLIALDFALGPTKEIIIAGEKNSTLVQDMIKEIHSRFVPSKVILLKEKNSELARYASFLKNYDEMERKPAVYICENYMCRMPVNNLENLRRLLSDNV